MVSNWSLTYFFVYDKKVSKEGRTKKSTRFFFMILLIGAVFCFYIGCQQQVEEGLTEEEVNVIMGEVVKVYNNADMDTCDKIFSADYVEYDPIEGETVGIDAFKESIRAAHEEFSNINLSIDEVFIKGDKVAIRWT